MTDPNATPPSPESADPAFAAAPPSAGIAPPPAHYLPPEPGMPPAPAAPAALVAPSPYQQPPVPQVVYQQQVRVKGPSNGPAVTSMVLGIVSIVFGLWAWVPIIGIFNFVVAVPTGIIAVFSGIKAQKLFSEVGVGKAQWTTGLVLGYISLGICAITLVFWIIALIGTAATGGVIVNEIGTP